jgi:hypothetical protein
LRFRVLLASRLQSYRVTPLPPWPRCFQLTFAVCHLAAGPRSLASPGSSSRALSLLYRVLTDSDPPGALAGFEHLPWGSSPHRGVNIQSPLAGEVPTLTYVPSSAFLALSTACSSRCLVGLFHPTATSGIHSSGAFPATKPPRLIILASPLVVDDSRLQSSCPDCPAPAVSPSGC